MAIVVLWFVFAALVGFFAAKKGRSGFGGFLLAVVISPLLAGLIVLLLKKDTRAIEYEMTRGGENKKCPFCAEIIKAEATVCRFCGRDMPVAAPRLPGDRIGPMEPLARARAESFGERYQTVIIIAVCCFLVIGAAVFFATRDASEQHDALQHELNATQEFEDSYDRARATPQAKVSPAYSPSNAFQPELRADKESEGSSNPTPDRDPTPGLQPRELSAAVVASKARAVAKHPALATPGTPINTAFVTRYKLLAARNDRFLQSPTWPEQLADECAAAIPPAFQ